MADWTEDDTTADRAICDLAVPRRDEIVNTIVSLVPFEKNDTFRIVEIGSGDGLLAAALLNVFPRATLLGLEGAKVRRDATIDWLSEFDARARVRPFDLAALDWWDVMSGAGLVVSSLCLHHLNDAKKQYLYKAIAERLSVGGAFLAADVVDPVHDAARKMAAQAWHHDRLPAADHPAQLFHQLVWLKHAGFTKVDCFWMFAGHAIFGGFK